MIEALTPWMAQWWADHSDTPPTVIVRCHCGTKVGEVKVDGTTTLLLAKTVAGERAVPSYQVAALTLEELEEEIRSLDDATLRHLPDGQRIPKRNRLPDAVGPLASTPLLCPEHDWLDGYHAELAAFVADTAPGTKRKFTVRQVL